MRPPETPQHPRKGRRALAWGYDDRHPLHALHDAVTALGAIGITEPAHPMIELAVRIGVACEATLNRGVPYDYDDSDVRDAFVDAALRRVAIPTDCEGLRLLLTEPALLARPDSQVLPAADDGVLDLATTLVDALIAPGRPAPLISGRGTGHRG